MPNLLLFAPCHKAILDKLDNSLSLIGILHGLTINPSAESLPEPLPDNAVMPLNWAIGAIWLRISDDDGKTFEQRLEIITPNDVRLYTTPQPFKMTHRTHHLAMATDVFPMGVSGEYKLVLQLRETGHAEWKSVSEYPIQVSHAQSEAQKAG